MPPVEERSDKIMLASWPEHAIKPAAIWPETSPTWSELDDVSDEGTDEEEDGDEDKEDKMETQDGHLVFTAFGLKGREFEPQPFRSAITNVDYFLNRSLSHLIQHCLGYPEAEADGAEQPLEELPPLHALCAQYSPSLDNIRTLILEGCDPNQISYRGRAPLHTLLLAEHAPSTPLAPLVSALCEAGARLDLIDAAGNIPLNCLSALLSAGRMQEAAEICKLMLSANAGSSSGGGGEQSCDVNHINLEDRSLLSYSASYLDESAELTRVLVNNGGRVWPRPAPISPVSVDQLAQDREQSAFTWFLRSLIEACSLDGAENTLTCLCHEMGRDPARMKSHVMRIMLSEGKHPRVLGPLYLQLKLVMAPFWSEPQHLRYLAWNSIRKSIGPKRLNSGSRQLGLPSPLRKYLTLSSSRSTKD